MIPIIYFCFNFDGLSKLGVSQDNWIEVNIEIRVKTKASSLPQD